MVYVTLAAGIALLLFCGDLLVRGAVALAVRLNIPAIVIGLTIVAFGTSAPELVVSLRAALAGAPGLAVGNVVGSNICNILLVLGLPALICATDCNQPLVIRNTLYVLGASLLFIGLCYYSPIGFWDGLVLFGLMVAYLVESGRRAARRPDPEAVIGDETIELIDGVSGLPNQRFGIIGCLAAGLIGLPLGAQLTVSAATGIAMNFAVDEAVIGLTIVALGTSLPELATTLAAALRGHAGLAIGNALGSNLFNLLAILGLTAMVRPLPVPDFILNVDMWVMLAAALVITPFVLWRKPITRGPGMAFVAMYIAYIVFVFMPRADEMAKLAIQ